MWSLQRRRRPGDHLLFGRRLRRRRYLAQHTPSLLPGRIWPPGRSVLADRAERISSSKIRYTNNISERHLRPSVIFRKVMNGFRCEWGAETYAALRSLVSTTKVNGASVLDTLRFVLSTKLPVEHIARVG
jgi:Transposase IS66 family